MALGPKLWAQGPWALNCFMTTAVNPNSRKYVAFKGKNTAENTAKIVFLTFSAFCVVFGPFLRSWRPGNASKGFLEVVR